MGDDKVCGALGTASTTAEEVHNVRFKVNNNSTIKYTKLPTLKVTVNGVKGTVDVPDKISCSLGGFSVPIVVTANVVPFNDV